MCSSLIDGQAPVVRGFTSEREEAEWVVGERARDVNERALLHVAGTRAMHSLYVTWSGELSPLLGVEA